MLEKGLINNLTEKGVWTKLLIPKNILPVHSHPTVTLAVYYFFFTTLNCCPKLSLTLHKIWENTGFHWPIFSHLLCSVNLNLRCKQQNVRICNKMNRSDCIKIGTNKNYFRSIHEKHDLWFQLSVDGGLGLIWFALIKTCWETLEAIKQDRLG